jgi:hypothetical protein
MGAIGSGQRTDPGPKFNFKHLYELTRFPTNRGAFMARKTVFVSDLSAACDSANDRRRQLLAQPASISSTL